MNNKQLNASMLVLGVSLLLAACQPSMKMTKTLDESYQAAVADAAIARKDEIATNLMAVDRSNKQLTWSEDGSKLLVVTWKAQQAYEKFLKPYQATSDNEAYAVWVTLAPQVKQFCRAQAQTQSSLNLKLKQYLGLNPEWSYDVFVEMWVSPEDLFRPCVDPETNDQRCNLHFAKGDAPKVKNINDYKAFYQQLYYRSFRSSAGVPWTGLGYTYNWAESRSEVGASEFILSPKAAYKIHRVSPTQEYCAQSH